MELISLVFWLIFSSFRLQTFLFYLNPFLHVKRKGFIFRGYNIGTRLVDEFLAKSNVSRCVDFKETADVIAKVFAKLHSNT